MRSRRLPAWRPCAQGLCDWDDWCARNRNPCSYRLLRERRSTSDRSVQPRRPSRDPVPGRRESRPSKNPSLPPERRRVSACQVLRGARRQRPVPAIETYTIDLAELDIVFPGPYFAEVRRSRLFDCDLSSRRCQEQLDLAAEVLETEGGLRYNVSYEI